jgi:hypothetical protein
LAFCRTLLVQIDWWDRGKFRGIAQHGPEYRKGGAVVEIEDALLEKPPLTTDEGLEGDLECLRILRYHGLTR